MNADRITFLFLLLAAGPLAAQQNLATEYRTTGSAVVAAFEPQRAVLQKSSAVMLNGREEIAYGVVVSPEGHILTKASEIEGVKSLAVTVDTTKFKEVKILATDPKWDVAVVKVEAAGLVPVVFAPSSNIPQGTWLVGNGASSRSVRRALPCIVSAKPREIPVGGGGPLAGVALGVGLKEGVKELIIDDVGEASGAKAAGLQKGDVILSIEGRKVAKKEDIAEAFKGLSSGDTVKVGIRRGKEEKTLDVKLLARSEMMGPNMDRNDQMSGEVSKRRTGFPRIMQTDLLASKSTVGGPLIDLDGRCVGMNIARANRSESFAIPVEELKKLVEHLLSKGQ